MSFKNLGNKQTIVLHNCEKDNQKYDLVITPHTQTVEYIRTKRQTIKRKIINKQRQITRKSFSKNRNAFSESEANSLDELYKFKNSIKKIDPFMINFIFPTKKQLQIHQKEEKEEQKSNISTNQYTCIIGINQLDTLIVIY